MIDPREAIMQAYKDAAVLFRSQGDAANLMANAYDRAANKIANTLQGEDLAEIEARR